MWQPDDGVTHAAGPDGQITSDEEATTVLQAAIDALPSQGDFSGTGVIDVRNGHYVLDDPLALPEHYSNLVFWGDRGRGKGWTSGGGIVFIGGGDLGGDPLVRTQRALDTDDDNLTVYGLTFAGVKFAGNGNAGYLVDLPDADTVQFDNCNFSGSGEGFDHVRCYASDGLSISKWGLPGKIEFRHCEFARTGRDYVRFVDNTQNVIQGCMFNPTDRNHLYVESSNKVRIYGNEFNKGNLGGHGSGGASHVWVTGDAERLSHDIVVTGNILNGGNQQDGYHEEGDRVWGNTVVGNDITGSFRDPVALTAENTQAGFNGYGQGRHLGDLAFPNTGGGVVLTSPDGSEQRRVSITNDGELTLDPIE